MGLAWPLARWSADSVRGARMAMAVAVRLPITRSSPCTSSSPSPSLPRCRFSHLGVLVRSFCGAADQPHLFFWFLSRASRYRGAATHTDHSATRTTHSSNEQGCSSIQLALQFGPTHRHSRAPQTGAAAAAVQSQWPSERNPQSASQPATVAAPMSLHRARVLQHHYNARTQKWTKVQSEVWMEDKPFAEGE